MMSPSESALSASETTLVRRMASSDISSVLIVLKESPEASMWSEDSLLKVASEGAAWIAERNGRVVGILIGQSAADEFEILNLAVGPDFRRLGVATQLVNATIEDARARGAHQTYLEVRASNEAGVAFYSRFGFRVCGRRAKYYRDPVEDAVVMVLHK
jgi:ribosomal-protein-alanine N-acetyltransferase